MDAISIVWDIYCIYSQGRSDWDKVGVYRPPPPPPLQYLFIGIISSTFLVDLIERNTRRLNLHMKTQGNVKRR
jgi:hypothetical protein